MEKEGPLGNLTFNGLKAESDARCDFLWNLNMHLWMDGINSGMNFQKKVYRYRKIKDVMVYIVRALPFDKQGYS